MLPAADATSSLPLVPADVKVSFGSPYQWDVTVADDNLEDDTAFAVVHSYLSFGAGGDVEVIARVNGKAFMMLRSAASPDGRLVSAVGAILNYGNEPVPNSGKVYFPNYTQAGSVRPGVNSFELEVLPIGQEPPASVTLHASSILEVTPSDEEELQILAPRAVRPVDGQARFEVSVSRRGVRPPLGAIAASVQAHGAITGAEIRPVRVDERGVGLYEVSAVATGPGGILIGASGAYNSPSAVVAISEPADATTRPIGPAVGVLLMPVLLAAVMAVRNGLTARRRARRP